ncbi:MAG: hypothetical protein HPY76_10845 [Anaerolineae bacterium]|nr:hypothetical protein [Anaerolineae bacterium]
MSVSPDIDALTAEILSSPKYRRLDLPPGTVQDLLRRELAAGRTAREALKAARAKLHTIVAPYLGDPDYADAARQLDAAFGADSTEALQQVCQTLLASHASTRERLPHLPKFYQAIFEVTSTPHILLDLACGLNPLALPWMGLPSGIQYHAYDLHAPRVRLINHFLSGYGLPASAHQQDILLEAPRQPADVAFFFKEAHRFEQRRRGCNRDFWQALNVDWLVVTLPGESLSGRHEKRDQQRRLVARTLTGLPWQVTEFEIGGEMVFCIDRRAGGGA